MSHQCPKTRSDALDEATQTRHAKRPDHYLCDTVEQLFTHLSSLGGKVVAGSNPVSPTQHCPRSKARMVNRDIPRWVSIGVCTATGTAS